jgi:Protein of unknown function (DUF3830)
VFENNAVAEVWDELTITVGAYTFVAQWETQLSPVTCAAFKRLLPFSQSIARWSGEACWIPLETLDLKVPLENPTGRPAPGQVLFYPAGISETEILLPYGAARFTPEQQCQRPKLRREWQQQADNRIGQAARRHFGRLTPKLSAQGPRDLLHPYELAGGNEAFARRCR